MLALLGALVAGVLTTLAPCVLPLLPIIVGGSITGTRARAVTIAAALGLSVVSFTLLLRASTALVGIDPAVWNAIAGGALIVLGVLGLFPRLWESISGRLGLQRRTADRLAAARRRQGWWGAVLTGAALGPVFTSCSPLYGYVIVTVLPADLGYGLLLLTAYVVGLCGTLLLLALTGRRLLSRLGWLADSEGLVRRALGAVFIGVGLMVLFGWDRALQAWLVENSPLRLWELDQGFIPE